MNRHDGGPNPTREPRAKLNENDVRVIRADYAAGKWNQHDLAYIYGVTASTVSAVIHRHTWRDVTDQPSEQES
jgi:uncharacterized protein YjcR